MFIKLVRVEVRFSISVQVVASASGRSRARDCIRLSDGVCMICRLYICSSCGEYWKHVVLDICCTSVTISITMYGET